MIQESNSARMLPLWTGDCRARNKTKAHPLDLSDDGYKLESADEPKLEEGSSRNEAMKKGRMVRLVSLR